MVFLLQSRPFPTQAHKGLGTPTITTLETQDVLYVATYYNGVYRVNLHTNQVVWHVGSGTIYEIAVDQGLVLFTGHQLNNDYIEAVSATTGNMLWQKQLDLGAILQEANGIVDVATFSFAVGRSTVYAFKASTGALLWSYPATSGDIRIALQNNIVYGVSGSLYFALNNLTGVPLWQKMLIATQTSSLTPVINNGNMYFVNCATMCSLWAVNATNGDTRWHTTPLPAQATYTTVPEPPAVLNGIVYVALHDGTIRGYDTTTGQLRWTDDVGAVITNPLRAAQGIIYVPMSKQDGPSLLEITVANKSVKSYSLGTYPNFYPFLVIGNGFVAVADDANNIRLFNTAHGQEMPSLDPQGIAAPINTFVLFTSNTP